jgi:AraC-like DNA-binding protein
MRIASATLVPALLIVLPEPLSPALIAAAHQISVRYLHHLFRQEEQTVGEFIRNRRLERCRADLSDPRLRDRSVVEVGSRWGFTDAATFSRTFKEATGTAPGEYRRRVLKAEDSA